MENIGNQLRGKKMIIRVSTNSKNKLWGGEVSDKNGEEVLATIKQGGVGCNK